MRRTVLASLIACLFATSAFAGGMNLRWDACAGQGGVVNKAFACNTNSGTDYLFVSFVSDTALPQILGVEFSIEVNSTSSAMPSWWLLRNAGSCRQAGIGMSLGAGPEAPGCTSPFLAAGAGGLASYTQQFAGADNFRRLLGVVAVAPEDAFTAPAGQELTVVRLNLNHSRTVGSPSCAGCSTPVCLGLHKLKVTRPAGVGDVPIYLETTPGGSAVTWQGAAVTSYVDPFPQGNDPGPDRLISCALPVPARNHTWGGIKAFYR
ncbi:MAG: hypothetical protein U0704_07795 [Candidatus Eisenbacteria bacterium]